jgi:hypothetical protein
MKAPSSKLKAQKKFQALKFKRLALSQPGSHERLEFEHWSFS